MNGPQHYAEAERILSAATAALVAGHDVSQNLAAAQVHATLALAAATMDAADVVHYTDRTDDSKHTSPMDLPCDGAPNWQEVLS